MIKREPGAAATTHYDLIVVGGGVYGAMLTLQAALRGLKPLLLERDDFGSQTSWNSLRIVHGGLRYLQKLDFARFRESVRERSWFLEAFPDLVHPLPCLMPLYGGIKRPAVLRAALGANDLLSSRRNSRLRFDRTIREGRVIGAEETIELFPIVRQKGLKGGALWYDGVMEHSERLIIEILHWACSAGATCLNYLEAINILEHHGRTAGVWALDKAIGGSIEFRAPVVVNCAGPWSREFARKVARDIPELFRPSLAFNVFINRTPPFDVAAAVSPPRLGARTYFLHPWKQGVLAGTFHAPWSEPLENPRPNDEQLRLMLADLTAAMPNFPIVQSDVAHVHAGLLPVRQDGSIQLTDRPVIQDHGALGGMTGFFSVSGVKFTTARSTAEQTLRKIYGRLPVSTIPRPFPEGLMTGGQARELLNTDPGRFNKKLRLLAEREAVLYPEDLMLRRTDWGYPSWTPSRGDPLAAAVNAALPSSLSRTRV